MDEFDVNKSVLFWSEKTRKILENQKPVNKDLLNRVKKSFEEKGLSIAQGKDIDDYLERTGREATILSSGDMLLHSKISASGLFEELIHWSQIRKYGPTISKLQNCMCEIEAKEKLLKYATSYGITDYEVEVINNSLLFYKKQLELLKGGSDV